MSSEIPLHRLRNYKDHSTDSGFSLESPDPRSMPSQAVTHATVHSRRHRERSRGARYDGDSEEEQGLLNSGDADGFAPTPVRPSIQRSACSDESCSASQNHGHHQRLHHYMLKTNHELYPSMPQVCISHLHLALCSLPY